MGLFGALLIFLLAIHLYRNNTIPLLIGKYSFGSSLKIDPFWAKLTAILLFGDILWFFFRIDIPFLDMILALLPVLTILIGFFLDLNRSVRYTESDQFLQQVLGKDQPKEEK